MNSRALFGTLLVISCSLVLGALVGVGMGLKLAVGLSAVCVGLFLARMSPALLVGFGLGWLPVAGRLSVVSLGKLPDVTVERLGVIFICFAVSVSVAGNGFALPRDRRLRVALGLWLPALGVILLSALSSQDLSNGVRQFADVYALPTLALVVLSAIPWSAADVSNVSLAALSGAVGWVGLGFVEMLTRHSIYTDTGVPFGAFDSYVRPGGPFINPAALGLVLGCLAILGLAWILGHPRGRVAPTIVLIVLVFGLVVTLTRSAWLGFAVGGLLVLGWLAPRSRFTTLSLAGLVVAAAFVVIDLVGQGTVLARFNDEGTAFNRVAAYATAFRLSLRSPLVGLGIGAYRSLASSSLVGLGTVAASAGAGVLAPHNSVLLVAVESGWPAALGLVLAFSLMLAFAVAKAFESRDWISVGTVGVLACYAVNSMLFDAQLQVHSSVILALLIGTLIGHLSHRAVLEPAEVRT